MAVDYQTWQSRADGLDQHIGLVRNRIAFLDGQLMQVAGRNLPRVATLLAVVDALKVFAKGHFDYFRDGFDLHVNRTFEPSNDFPPDYVLSQVIDRVADDVRALQQIAEQRALYALDTTLDKADKLAQIALMPMIDAGHLPAGTTAITYFQRDASVRVIPYASVALIGVPLTARSLDRDFLAIGHEVGHYVYWNAQEKNTVDKPLKEAIKATANYQAIKSWAQKWREEIFADVYGALVGGRAIAFNFQDLLNEESKDGFEEDDGHHPISRLRAYIYQEVLKQKHNGGANPQSIVDLVTHWDSILNARNHVPASNVLPTIKVKLDGGEKFCSPDEVKQEILAVVNVMLNFLPSLTDAAAFTPLPLSLALDAQAQGVTAYADFAGKIAAVTGQVTNAQLNPQLRVYATWNDWANEKHFMITDPPGGPIPKHEWLRVLQANGWTTSGPHLPPGDI